MDARPPPGGEVEVVIATRDRRERLLATLERLSALPERPALTVVDNGSGDGTADEVASAFPAVRVLRCGADMGARARNLGVLASRRELIAFADDDSWWAPGAISAAARDLRGDPGLGLVATRILVGPAARLDPTCRLMERSPLPGRRGLPGPRVMGFLACGAMVRRSAFLAVGGFHPRYGFGSEEELVAIDLAAAGWDLAYDPAVTTHHHPAAGDHRRRREERSLRNSLWTAWLRLPRRAALGRSGRLLAGAPPEARRRAVAEALAGLAWIGPERRVVPPRVVRELGLVEGSAD